MERNEGRTQWKGMMVEVGRNEKGKEEKSEETINTKNGTERGGAALHLPIGFPALSHNEILYFMYYEKGKEMKG